ncbi:MAG TPA: DCC1-like thiol-disulfide oxidoreductase family protein [Edaphobacter sp.]
MTESERSQIEGCPVLLYDGICALCNGVVRFVLRHDHRREFRFAPLQSCLAKELIAMSTSTSQPEGVILITDTLTPHQRLYRRSDAVIRTLHILGHLWERGARLSAFLARIPRPWREFGYTVIARIRYRVFGRYAKCPIPTADQRDRILGVSE